MHILSLIAQLQSYTRFFEFRLWRNVIFDRQGASDIGCDVSSRQNDHGFLINVKNRSFASIVSRSQVMCRFSLIINSDLSISAVRGRLEPEVTSFDHSFLVVFNTYYLSNTNHSVAIYVFGFSVVSE
jgi:hypothetical protein